MPCGTGGSGTQRPRWSSRRQEHKTAAFIMSRPRGGPRSRGGSCYNTVRWLLLQHCAFQIELGVPIKILMHDALRMTKIVVLLLYSRYAMTPATTIPSPAFLL